MPPAGWTPPPGWAPDSSWLPAPPGWSFWANQPSRRSQDLVRALWIGIPIALVVFVLALFAAQAFDDVVGCGSVDPTDPANYSRITIMNDSSARVVIDHCVGGYCRDDLLPRPLGPGQSFADDAACGSTGSDMTSWELRDASTSRLIGYIAVDSPRSQRGILYRVSRASGDRRTPTASG